MAKHLRHKYSDVPFENEHQPGCMSGVRQVLDFHPWYNVKKMLPYSHRRQGGAGRLAEGIKSPRTGEAQDFMDAEVDNFLIEEKITETHRTSKKFGKARIKVLVAEEMSKEDRKRRISASPARLLRTDSIHHLEPSHHDLPDEIRSYGESPRSDLHQDDTYTPAASTCDPLLLKPPDEAVACNKQCEVCGDMNTVNYLGHNQLDELQRQLFEKHTLLLHKLDKVKDVWLKQKSMNAKELPRDVALHQSKEFLDALEIFNVNKELFLKILQDPDSALAQHFQGLQASNAKIELTKSGSFPVADLSGRKYVGRPSKNKDMQKEIGSFAKQEGKLQVGTSLPMLTTIHSSGDICAQSMPLIAADDTASSVLKPNKGSPEIGETGRSLFCSLGSSHALKNHMKNQVVINRFKDIRQRIKQAITESRKEGNRISMDGMLHRIPYGRKFSKDAMREMADESATYRDCKDSPRSSFESDGSVSSLGKSGVYGIRRTASLNESLNRYSQLFESSFSQDTKRHLSDRLKLTNEDNSLVGCAPKALGRILSSPELKSCSLQREVSGDALYSGMPTRILVDSNRNVKCARSDEQEPVGLPVSRESWHLDAFVEESQEKLVEVGESSPFDGNEVELVSDINGVGNAKVGGTSGDLDNLTMGVNSSTSQHEQDIGPASSASTKLAQPSPISVLDSCFQEDLISPAKFSISEDSELKPSKSGMDSPNGIGSNADTGEVQVLSKQFNNDFLHVQLDRKDEADFNYVREVLKLSGFSRNKYFETWNIPEKPVDSLFEEVEGCSPLKPDCARHEAGSGYDHQLLFDIINELLSEIYERSFIYCPRPLSCNSHIRPLPKGYHVLEEVWKSIRWYLSSRPELHPSVDYVVGRDLAKGDGWMNLQFDTENVGLELEEWILDDLLDEVVYS